MSREAVAVPKAPPALTDVEYYILKAITERPLHGLGIFEAVARQTDNQVILIPGTLYAALKRMLHAGWITMVKTDEQGEAVRDKRKIYTVTPAGLEVFGAKVEWFLAEGKAGRQILARYKSQ